MIVPDPRWEEPSLLIPGRKSVGPVQIDWRHPLALDLKAFYMPTNTPTPQQDIVGNPVSYSYAVATDRVVPYIYQGRVFAIPEGTFSVAGSVGISITTKGIDNSKDITYMAEGLFQTGSAFNDVGGLGFNSVWSWLDLLSGVYRVSAYTAYDTTNVITPAEGLVANYGLIWRHDNTYQTIREGKFSHSGTATRRAFSGNTINLCRDAGGVTMAFDRTDGAINALAWQAVWNRSLSSSEAYSMYRNPYQFLIPA